MEGYQELDNGARGTRIDGKVPARRRWLRVTY